MRLKNAIARTFFSHGSFRSNPIRKTSPDQRNDSSAIEAHGRSECEEARSSALPFRANRRESAALEVGPTLDHVGSSTALQRSAAVFCAR